jgi:predicted transposase/invertase (TIGR01784 family)
MEKCEIDLFSPCVDFVFKGIFADEAILKNFLTTVLDWQYGPIEHLTFSDKELFKTSAHGKEVILDLKATLKNGSIISIEIQCIAQKHYIERSLYYWAKLYEDQLKSGENYSKLMPVVSVNILNHKHPDILENNPYNRYSLMNEETFSKLTDKLSIHYIELGKFTEQWISGNTKNNWLTFLKDPKEVLMHSEDYNQALLNAVEKLKWLSQDPEKRAEYEARQKALRDYYGGLMTAKEEGLEQGIQEGIQQGIEQGIEKGRIDVAINFLKVGNISLELIAQCSGLSLEKVYELNESVNNTK